MKKQKTIAIALCMRETIGCDNTRGKNKEIKVITPDIPTAQEIHTLGIGGKGVNCIVKLVYRSSVCGQKRGCYDTSIYEHDDPRLVGLAGKATRASRI